MQRLRDYDRDKVCVSSIMCANGWLFDAALIGYLQDPTEYSSAMC